MQLNTTYNHQPTAPQPLGQAIRQLPTQYIKVLTKPSARTFAQEKGKATWSSIWLQLIALGLISAVLQTLGLLITPPVFSSAISGGLSQSTLLTITIVFLAIAEIILTPLSFFAAGAIIYGIARLVGGKGGYREQIYTTLLFGVPLVTVSYLLFLIPAVGVWLIYVPHIYSLVLLFISLKAVHYFGKGEA